VTSAVMVAISPAPPNALIKSESENCNATKDKAAVAWVRTQAGPTIHKAFRKAARRSSPAIRRSRAAKASCMLSEKLITMISGVMTLINMLRRKSSQPSPPSANSMARSGGAAATIMNEIRRKKRIAIAHPAAKPMTL